MYEIMVLLLKQGPLIALHNICPFQVSVILTTEDKPGAPGCPGGPGGPGMLMAETHSNHMFTFSTKLISTNNSKTKTNFSVLDYRS